MIEVRSLRKSFDGFTALDGLDISVPDGAVYGLVGPNGAGKSTLIRHLAGILRQDAGEVLYDGEAVFENPAVKAQIAYTGRGVLLPRRVDKGHDAALPAHVPKLQRGALQ